MATITLDEEKLRNIVKESVREEMEDFFEDINFAHDIEEGRKSPIIDKTKFRNNLKLKIQKNQ